MGKYFEIEYSPEQFDSGSDAPQPNPWGGICVVQPEDCINARFTPSSDDFYFHNSEVRSRPAFVPSYIVAPDTNPILGLAPGFNFTGGIGSVLIAFTVGGVYNFNGTIWTALTGSAGILQANVPVSWRVFANVLYFTNGTHLSSWDGVGVGTLTVDNATVGGVHVGGFYLDELDNHLILVNTTEGGTNFPNRIRWSANGLPSVWDPAVNVNAGSNDFLEVPDQFTGVIMQGQVGFLLRNDGITEVSITGSGVAPFAFNHLWASKQGIGNVTPYGFYNYGAMGCFVARDDAYTVSSANLLPIGTNVRDVLMQALGTQKASNSPGQSPVFGFIAPYMQGLSTNSRANPSGNINTPKPNIPFLAYYLFIPIANGNSQIYVFSHNERNWARFNLTNYQLTGWPAMVSSVSQQDQMLIPTIDGGGNPHISIFDTSNFNDSSTASTYFFRVEHIQANRVPTVRRVVITYRDLGAATVQFRVSGTNDNGVPVQSNLVSVSIGGVNPGGLSTKFVDITMSGFRPQLSIIRNANGGPVSFTRVVMVGTIEEVSL